LLIPGTSLLTRRRTCSRWLRWHAACILLAGRERVELNPKERPDLWPALRILLPQEQLGVSSLTRADCRSHGTDPAASSGCTAELVSRL